jgi:hypothetical protein
MRIQHALAMLVPLIRSGALLTLSAVGRRGIPLTDNEDKTGGRGPTPVRQTRI